MQRKNESSLQRFCPNCGSPKIKRWSELTEDEKFLVERLPASEEKRRHRFCTRCFFEYKETEAEKA